MTGQNPVGLYRGLQNLSDIPLVHNYRHNVF